MYPSSWPYVFLPSMLLRCEYPYTTRISALVNTRSPGKGVVKVRIMVDMGRPLWQGMERKTMNLGTLTYMDDDFYQKQVKYCKKDGLIHSLSATLGEKCNVRFKARSFRVGFYNAILLLVVKFKIKAHERQTRQRKSNFDMTFKILYSFIGFDQTRTPRSTT